MRTFHRGVWAGGCCLLIWGCVLDRDPDEDPRPTTTLPGAPRRLQGNNTPEPMPTSQCDVQVAMGGAAGCSGKTGVGGVITAGSNVGGMISDGGTNSAGSPGAGQGGTNSAGSPGAGQGGTAAGGTPGGGMGGGPGGGSGFGGSGSGGGPGGGGSGPAGTSGTGGGGTTGCFSDSQCGDNKNCTADTCSQGTCLHFDTCMTVLPPVCSPDGKSSTQQYAGSCVQQDCTYQTSTTPCPNGCDVNTGLCQDDPCINVMCPPSDDCHDVQCLQGTCVYPVKDKSACDDGNACSTGDVCNDIGKCQGQPVLCNDLVPPYCVGSFSHQRVLPGDCNGGGGCLYSEKITECSAGCNQANGLCNDDKCAGVTCQSPPSPCYQPTGNCTDGNCSYALNDGAFCSDGDLCTDGDTCQSGTCAGKTKSCNSPPASVCSGPMARLVYDLVGMCNGLTGDCSYLSHVETCAMGCTNGECNGPCAGVVCNSPSQVYSDPKEASCHLSLGKCEVQNNAPVCVYPPKNPGDSCDDGDGCTAPDSCNATGLCEGKPIVCPAQQPTCTGDTLTTYGTASCTSGACSAQATMTMCSDGCDPGGKVCAGDPCVNVVCNDPPSPCHNASGTCAKGVCSYALLPVGALCNDGESCTEGDTCGPDGECAGVTKECKNIAKCVGDESHVLVSNSCKPGGDCDYTEQPPTPCAAGCDTSTGYCKGDTCMGCTNPPSPCHEPVGKCISGTCQYGTEIKNNVGCPTGDLCTVGVCQNGTCEKTVSCDKPDKFTCIDGTITSYAPTGVCKAGKCDYKMFQDKCFYEACDAKTGLCAGKPCDTEGSVDCDEPLGPCYQLKGICDPIQKRCSYEALPTDTECFDQGCTGVCNDGAFCVIDPTTCGAAGASGSSGQGGEAGTAAAGTSGGSGQSGASGQAGASGKAGAGQGGAGAGGKAGQGGGGGQGAQGGSLSLPKVGKPGASEPEAVQEGGCGCSTPGASTPTGLGAALAALAALVGRGRAGRSGRGRQASAGGREG